MSDEGPDEQHNVKPVRLEDAYALATPDDSRALYARWAATYETDFVRTNLYVIPTRVAEVFAGAAAHLADPALPDDERAVLDVGCGTGLAGRSLTASGGDWVIDGIDISPQMLAESAAKTTPDGRAIYRRLFEADLTEPVRPGGSTDVAESPDGTYAGMLSSGTFTHGHLGPDALAGLLRFGRPGCIFAIGINAEHYAALGFEARIHSELGRGTIEGFEPHTVQMYLPGSPHFGETAIVAVFRTPR